MADIGTSYADSVGYILNSTTPKVKVLIMNGADDFIVNTGGVERYVRNVNWVGAGAWLAAPKETWYQYPDAPGYVWGTWKRYDQFTYAVVNKAGHEVPFYVPDSAHNLVDRFINDDWST